MMWTTVYFWQKLNPRNFCDLWNFVQQKCRNHSTNMDRNQSNSAQFKGQWVQLMFIVRATLITGNLMFPWPSRTKSCAWRFITGLTVILGCSMFRTGCWMSTAPMLTLTVGVTETSDLIFLSVFSAVHAQIKVHIDETVLITEAENFLFLLYNMSDLSCCFSMDVLL